MTPILKKSPSILSVLSAALLGGLFSAPSASAAAKSYACFPPKKAPYRSPVYLEVTSPARIRYGERADSLKVGNWKTNPQTGWLKDYQLFESFDISQLRGEGSLSIYAEAALVQGGRALSGGGAGGYLVTEWCTYHCTTQYYTCFQR